MNVRKPYAPLAVAAALAGLLIAGPARSEAPAPATARGEAAAKARGGAATSRGEAAAKARGGAATVRGEAAATASVVAADEPIRWQTAAGGAPNVTIAAGSAVDFAYPAGGETKHNLVFTSSQPSSCTQTAGSASTGAVPPLPNPSSLGSPGWAGTCTFTTPGTYPFVCGIHAIMTGSVTVVGDGSPPPPPPPGATPPPPPPPGGPPPPPPPPPAAALAPAASAPRVPAIQHGFAVRGSVQVARAGSRLLVSAQGLRKILLTKGAGTYPIGRQSRPSVAARRIAFTVPLSALARRALHRRGKLAITLRITVTPPAGKAYTASRHVSLRFP